MATQDARDETMADEIEKLQQLRRTLDESEGAIGRLLYSATTWRSERDGQRKRADAMEKRAQEAEWDRDNTCDANGRLRHVLRDIRQIVCGTSNLVEEVRALKARCEEAERAASTMDGSSYVHRVERERSDWRERALASEAALAGRNAEFDRLKREAASLPDRIQEYEVAFAAINRALDGCDTPLEADKVVAKIRALKDQRDELADEDECAHKQLGAIAEILGCPGGTYSAMVETARGLRAQVESLRGQDGSAWSVGEQRKRAARRSDAFMEILASLPTPSSSKTGRWRCSGSECGCSAVLNVKADGALPSVCWNEWRWEWNANVGRWMHHCPGHDGSHLAERIGGAPEVTP